MDITDRLKREIARKSDLDRDKDLMRDALREIERLRAPDWRLIESAPKSGDFLAQLSTGYVTRARLINGRFFAADSMGEKRGAEPTYWMPLPELHP